jgi:hypothetical protein
VTFWLSCKACPDLFGKDEKLVRILAALAAGYPKEFQALEIGVDQRLLVCLPARSSFTTAQQKLSSSDSIIQTLKICSASFIRWRIQLTGCRKTLTRVGIALKRSFASLR